MSAPPLALLASVSSLHDAADIRFVDCSHDLGDTSAGVRAFAAGHLPGATHVHLDETLSGPKNGHNGRHPLPVPQDLPDWLARQGIGAQDRVVAYDRSGGMYAARFWWLMRWVGGPPVAILDGGFQAWAAAGLPIESTSRPAPAVPPMVARAERAQWVDVGFVRANLETREALVVDARGAGRFAGEGETIDPVGGHIPGARNRPYTANLAADGRFKPAQVLRAEWLAVLGDRPSEQVVAQCGSGVTACHNLFALELAGLPGARLYPGSWSEWCSDATRPVATGPL